MGRQGLSFDQKADKVLKSMQMDGISNKFTLDQLRARVRGELFIERSQNVNDVVKTMLASGLVIENGMKGFFCAPLYQTTIAEATPRQIIKGVCRICGCTEKKPCIHPSGRTCHFVSDDLCSRCAGEAAP